MRPKPINETHLARTLPLDKQPKTVAAILLAGGSGNRMQGAVSDKVLAPLAGHPVIGHSIRAFVESGEVDALVFVTRDEEQQRAIEAILADLLLERPPIETFFVRGGARRQDSVWSGLQACPNTTEIVLIHDCARPCVAAEAIKDSIEAAKNTGAACLARPVTDTIKSARSATHPESSASFVLQTVDRSKLWAVETPQTFRLSVILPAYRKVIESGQTITDDLSAIEVQGHPVTFVQNPGPNPKLTTPSDLPFLAFLLSRQ